MVHKLIRNLKKGCGLLHYALWPIAGIIVDQIDFPFYLSKHR